MTGRGPIALHGGGEFQAGDDRVLAELLRLAGRRADAIDPERGGAIQVSVIPTAGARGRPGIAAAHGVAAVKRLSIRAARPALAKAVLVVDAASAADPGLAAIVRDSGLIHFPGGDPDLIMSILRGTPVWDAVLAALDDGAVLAGASAGAMAFAEVTWTPGGLVPGMGLVQGLAVAPHADAATWSDVIARFGAGRADDIGILGLAERTALLVEGETWRAVGEGEVRWIAPGSDQAVVLRDGDRIARPR